MDRLPQGRPVDPFTQSFNSDRGVVVIGPGEYFDPSMLRRYQSVQRQKAEGRTGGGMKCPDCKRRALRFIKHHLFQCGHCGVGVLLVVDGGFLVLQAIVADDLRYIKS
jgi:ribosomal protein L37AE/L43A